MDFPPFQSTYSPYQNGASRVGSGAEGWNDFISNFSGPRRPGPESGMAVPHVLSLQAIVGTSFRTYWHGQYDEALRDSQDNADAMRNDPFLRRLVDERKHAVCSLKCSIEVDNERDPWQKAMKDSLTQQWKSIWHCYDLNWYLLEALWYGRYAGELVWKRKVMDLPELPNARGAAPGLPMVLGAPTGREKRSAMTIVRHIPYEGDKIGYDYDGVPYVLVYTGTQSQGQLRGADLGPLPNIHAKNMEYGYTTAGGKALFLRSQSWRQRFAIHQNEILDGPFMDAEKGDQIHGIGIRSVIYWYWWLRDEFLANVSDWCARTGLGVRLWYYESGNQASELAIDQAARDQSDKVNIKVPYIPGSDLKEPVQFVDTTGSGADLLLKIVQHVEDQIELYVVGQSMSRGATEPMNTGFGDRGRTEFARSTKFQITKRDAAKFGDTMTTDVLEVMKRWSFPPDLQEIPVRVVYNVDNPDPEQYMNSAKTFVDMGGTIREDEARQTLGFSSPHEGDAVLGGTPPVQPGMEGKEPPFGKNGSGAPPSAPDEKINGKGRFRRQSDHDKYARCKESVASLKAEGTEEERYQEYKKAIEEMLDGRSS